MNRFTSVLADPAQLRQLSTRHWDEVLRLARYAGMTGTLNQLVAEHCEAERVPEVKVREIEYAGKRDDLLRFEVKLSKKNGDILVIGPCCGATEEQSPPDSIFIVFVTESENSYLVVSMPPYVP